MKFQGSVFIESISGESNEFPNLSQNCTAQAEQFQIPLWMLYKMQVVCWDHADRNLVWIFACGIAVTTRIGDMKLPLLLGLPWLSVFPDWLVLQVASSSVSLRPFFLDRRLNGKSYVLHSGCLLALTWGSPLEEIISNSVKSQYWCSWKRNIWAVLATLSAVLATALLKHSCCWQNSCIFQDSPGQG